MLWKNYGKAMEFLFWGSVRTLVLGISNLIAAHAVHVTLQWIPRHCNISGNETADKLAKIGTTKNSPLHTKCHQTNTKKQCEGGLAE